MSGLEKVLWEPVRTTFTMIKPGDTVQVKFGTGTQDVNKLYPAPIKAPKSAFWATVAEVTRNGRYVSIVVTMAHTGRLVMESAAHGAITVARDVPQETTEDEGKREAAELTIPALATGYADSVTRYMVKHGGYTMDDAQATVTRYVDTVSKGERFGSNIDYVAWEVMGKDAAPEGADNVPTAPIPAVVACEACGVSPHALDCALAIEAERNRAEAMIGKRVRVTNGRLASSRLGLVTGRHETTAGDQYVEIDFGGITDSALATFVTVVGLITGHEASSHSRRGSQCRICGLAVVDHAEVNVNDPVAVSQWTGTAWGSTVNPERVAAVDAALNPVPCTEPVPTCERCNARPGTDIIDAGTGEHRVCETCVGVIMDTVAVSVTSGECVICDQVEVSKNAMYRHMIDRHGLATPGNTAPVVTGDDLIGGTEIREGAAKVHAETGPWDAEPMADLASLPPVACLRCEIGECAQCRVIVRPSLIASRVIYCECKCRSVPLADLASLPPVAAQVASIRQVLRESGTDSLTVTADPWPWSALRGKRKASKVTRRAWQSKLARKGR